MADIQDVPREQSKPMDEVALVAAIDDSDNGSYGSNLSNLTAALSAERALNIDLYLGKNVEPAPASDPLQRPLVAYMALTQEPKRAGLRLDLFLTL